MFSFNILAKAIRDSLEYNFTLDPVISNFMNGIKANNPDLVKRYGNSENVNHKCDGGLRPLHYAAKYAKGESGKEIMEFLLQNGGDPKIPDACGVTPLMMAAENYNVEAVEVLLSNEAAKNTLNWGKFISNETALHHALFHYGEQGEGLVIARLLIEAGADIDAPSRIGTTPKGFIAQVDLFESLRELISPSAQEPEDITAVPTTGQDTTVVSQEDWVIFN